MYAELERKVCTKCSTLKESKEFSRRNARPVGRAAWCKLCLNQWRREYREKHREKFTQYEFARGLRRNYGLTVKQYETMLRDQGECCACCGKHGSLFKRKLHVDHDHETGNIRGLLCTECNPGLGYFRHSTTRLDMAISYLKKFKK